MAKAANARTREAESGLDTSRLETQKQELFRLYLVLSLESFFEVLEQAIDKWRAHLSEVADAEEREKLHSEYKCLVNYALELVLSSLS